MDEFPNVLALDSDGAIEETAEAAGVDRAALLRQAGLGGGAILGGATLLGLLPAVASAAPSARSSAAGDIAILNFALTLEYLEAAFYAEANSKGKLTGETAQFAKVVGKHEAQHVAFLKTALGSHAVAKPTFDFKNTTTEIADFQKTAMALEETGVSAYAGAAPFISSKKYLAAALSVHSVEARHASWIRVLIGNGNAPLPAPKPFDVAETKAQVLKVVKSTGFITG
jgi:Ferritin-like domain